MFVAAAVSDGLDGYLARRRNQVTDLGIMLDPIADKVFAGVLVIMLIIFRDFPLWLAAAIIGRDLAILALGAVLLGKRHKPVSPNLTGKYAFAAVAVLLGSYVIVFPFGISLMTPIAVGLLVLSTVSYGHTFRHVARQGTVPSRQDRPVWKWSRIGLTLAVSALYLWRLYWDRIAGV
jgi:CDP-diacylglycerol--glycerol-3-phosphate 3-phosphatidyltransferase